MKTHAHIEERLFGSVGTSDCHKIGIMGGCGLECYVYLDGRCPAPDEMELVTEKDRELHNKLYVKEAQSHE